MMEVENLSRSYGATTAVKDVSFSIDNNEIVGLLGPNGAGKSTIMRMLSGALQPSAGTIKVDGKDIALNAHAMQASLGYLPESLPVYADLMVADYLDYAATLKGVAAAERGTAIADTLVALDLKDRALDPIRTLSRGMKQRVGVAQAILGRPRLLILDEPTNGLDPEQTEDMRKLIKLLSRRATIILSTHIMQEVEAVCDRVLVLNHGQLVLDETVDKLRRCGGLSLRTSGGGTALADALAKLPEISKVEHSSSQTNEEYTLILAAGADADDVADKIFHVVLTAGAKLYQLEQLTRDLDSVFRESTTADRLP